MTGRYLFLSTFILDNLSILISFQLNLDVASIK